jgi:hypothetical protein
MAKTVSVGCRMPQGVRLRVSLPIEDPTGDVHLREVAVYDIPGPGTHTAGPGLSNDVGYADLPAEHWDAWTAANQGSDLLTSGVLFLKGDEAAAAAATEANAAKPGGDSGSTRPTEPQKTDTKSSKG